MKKLFLSLLSLAIISGTLVASVATETYAHENSLHAELTNQHDHNAPEHSAVSAIEVTIDDFTPLPIHDIHLLNILNQVADAESASSCSHEWWKIGQLYLRPYTPKIDGCYAVKQEQFKCKKCGSIQSFVFNPTPVYVAPHKLETVSAGHRGTQHDFIVRCMECGYITKRYSVACAGPPCTLPGAYALEFMKEGTLK